ncbi:DNA mismatch repair protein [Gonapodya sp. JEL0774]|nr:DNA mismatch repair protein [Gonapodya sp. JEL0774]
MARIQRLDESVINRIAAGEVIQRPSNALKEMIENSLDAGATSIQVVCKDGGLKLLQIQDNGHGIQKDDLPLVEDMFYNTPIRLRAFRNTTEEYNRIVDVIEKYALHNASVGFSCKKVGASRADVHTPTASSITNGIQLIYGTNVAKELLGVQFEDKANEFSCSGFVTNPNYNMRKLNFILFINNRLVDHSNMKKAIESLFSLHLPKNTHPFVYLALSIKASNVDVNVHPTKREVHFLNEDAVIVSVCDQIANTLARTMQSRTFATQTVTVGRVARVIVEDAFSGEGIPTGGADAERKLLDSEIATSSFQRATKQSLLNLRPADDKSRLSQASGSIPSQKSQTFKVPEHKLVRTDSRVRTLDSFVHVASRPRGDTQKLGTPCGKSGDSDLIQSIDATVDLMDVEATTNITPNRKWIDVRLSSILELREEVESKEHKGITEVFRDCTFVGCVDQQLALIQHQVRLFMVNYVEISREFFYQLFLRMFSNLGHVYLPQTSIQHLIELALEEEEREKGGWNPQVKSKTEIATEIVDLLVDRRDMLEEYFSLHIDMEGNLQSLPLVLKGFTPVMEKLPTFFLRLGTEVHWDTEKECFQTIAEELANLYALEPPELYHCVGVEADEDNGESNTVNVERAYFRTVEHVLFPALRTCLVAPKDWAKGGEILEIANLPDLYKCFERC